jgi:hypothetical protein
VNPTSNYVITKNGKSAPAILLIATLDGLICGWNPAVDPDNAVIVIDNSTESPFPAGYDDLSFARNRDGNMVMYVTDGGQTLATANNWIEIYDGNFNLLRTFTDAFAPDAQTVYSARPVDGKIYVTTAAFTKGQGGAVDVFDYRRQLPAPAEHERSGRHAGSAVLCDESSEAFRVCQRLLVGHQC